MRRSALFACAILLALALPQGALGWTLTIATNGSGSGTIDGQGFDCEWDGIEQTGDCAETYAATTTVGVTAVPAGSVATWSGCDVAVGNFCAVESEDSDRTVTVTFKAAYLLTVTAAGTGSGTVTSSPAGVSCGTDCSESYADGTTVVLTATASAGSTFAGWGGACAGTGATCSLTLSSSKAVTATFDLVVPAYALSVAKEGDGTVTSSPGGIACGSDCAESFASGTAVTLAAVAADGWRFARWEGCPAPSGALCTVVLTAARTVTAVFADDVVDAEVLGAWASRLASGKRLLEAEIRTDEVVRVRLQLIRNGRVIASKTVESFRPAQTTVRLRIPRGVAGGRATAKVILTDRHGNADTFRQPVRVPA